jgi:hypothetical protein
MPAVTSHDNKPKKGKGGKPQRGFPIVTLEEAIKVPQFIRQKNNGHPWDSGLVAKACGGRKVRAEALAPFLTLARSSSFRSAGPYPTRDELHARD